MKIVAVLKGGPTDRTARRVLLTEQLGPALLALDAMRLGITVADEAADVPGPNPFGKADLPVALVNLYTKAPADPLIACLAEHFQVHAYAVEETIPTTWGDNPHAAPRDWPDGVKAPGVVAVSLLERRPDLDLDTFVQRWHGRMSPVSARIQPRTRYVRNLVVQALTPGAPPWQAIVEESWPTPGHVTNPFLFYGSKNPVRMLWQMGEILAAVAAITRPWRVRTFMASEWWIRS